MNRCFSVALYTMMDPTSTKKLLKCPLCTEAGSCQEHGKAVVKFLKEDLFAASTMLRIGDN